MNVSNNSRLFPNAARTRQVVENKRRLEHGLQEMQRDLRNPNEFTLRNIENRSRELSRLASQSDFPEQLHRVLRKIDRFARSQTGASPGMINRLLNVLGAPGRAINSWLKGREGQQVMQPIRDEVQNAINVLNQFTPMDDSAQVMSPEQAGGRMVPTQDAYPPVQPKNRIAPATPDEPDDGTLRHRNVTYLPDNRVRITGPGFDRVYRVTHPLITGKMMLAVGSSNVHSFGMKLDLSSPVRSSLIIRYWHKQPGGGRIPGATYEYLRVHPDFLDDMIKASSRGGFVWSTLRIRGTVAGHQYSYRIIRSLPNYLPRRAMVRNGQQIFVKRRMMAERRDGTKYTLTSHLPNQRIGPYRPSVKAPNVGNIDRGRNFSSGSGFQRR